MRSIKALAVALTLATGPLAGATPAAAQGVRPAEPQPDPAALSDGLAVEYYYDDFRDVSLSTTVARGPGEAGPPLPQLNYQSGIGRVLTSNASDFVGAKITGYVNFDRMGEWQVKITSNDGVRLRIGDETLFEDMAPHPDYDSPPLSVQIEESGWYPINILYYERKRTSTLKLWWKQPGANSFELVPAAAFKH